MEFHEFSTTFMISAEFSYFWRNFTFLVFWSVSNPPEELKNLNIPIGITRFPACGGQGPTRILQNVIFAWFLWNFRKFAENNEISVNIVKLMDFHGFSGFGGSEPLRPWFWGRNIKVLWRVAGSRKSWNFMEFHDLNESPQFLWNFLIFNGFHRIYKKSTVWRWHAKTQVIPMLFQWLQRSYALPGTSKHKFS